MFVVFEVAILRDVVASNSISSEPISPDAIASLLTAVKALMLAFVVLLSAVKV